MRLQRLREDWVREAPTTYVPPRKVLAQQHIDTAKGFLDLAQEQLRIAEALQKGALK